MGAEQFSVTVAGEDAQQAFHYAKEDAFYEYGHRGYTGTIAEKPGYMEATLPEGVSLQEFERALTHASPYWTRDEDGTLIEISGHRPAWAGNDWDIIAQVYNDKWGDCIAVQTEGYWTFMGWASS